MKNPGVDCVFKSLQAALQMHANTTQATRNIKNLLITIMALINANNGSALSGLVGRVVIVKTRWGSYMRSAPNYSESSWTGKQKVHRQRFKTVNAFCRQFKETVIPQIWNDPRERVCGHGRFLKANMPAFDAEGMLTDPFLIRLSTGVLEFPGEFQLVIPQQVGEPFKVSWPNADSGVRTRDELMVISSGEGKYSDILNTGILRGNKGGTFNLPQLKTEASHLYLFFGSKDRKNYSESVCYALDYVDKSGLGAKGEGISKSQVQVAV